MVRIMALLVLFMVTIVAFFIILGLLETWLGPSWGAFVWWSALAMYTVAWIVNTNREMNKYQRKQNRTHA